MTDVNNEDVRALLKQLIEFEREDNGPFPYDDIRKLMTRLDNPPQDFIADLDYYYFNILGYVSWGAKILNWSVEKMSEVKRYISLSFFEKHPQYLTLETWITEREIPDLYKLLSRTEFRRLTLLKLLEHLAGDGILVENHP